jgi:signal transduction histidine kinase
MPLRRAVTASPPSEAVSVVRRSPRARRVGRRALLRILLLACVLVVAAATSRHADWQPVSLVVALALAMMIADVLSVTARRVRMSAGLMVQVVAMALLGPAPAAAIGVVATIADLLINRGKPLAALNNMAIFGFLGLLGGVLFDVLSASFGLGPRDTAYAVLTAPVYLLLASLNLGLVATTSPGLEGTDRRRVLLESGLPLLPIELLNTLMAAAVVVVWAHAGLAAAAAMLLLLVLTLPLLRVVSASLKTGDDLLVLRDVSDQRADEVARLAADRERLLSEVLEAEERERARLAESLHDGPMQRLVALRQDAADAGTQLIGDSMADRLAAAIAETRAIISAFHPATVRELGFEASLRAAIIPFPAAQTVALNVENALDDRLLADTLLLPVAQELVINAIKHASPTTIQLSVREHDGHVVLEVNDDGVGIDTADASRKVQAGHLGLAMVGRRVEDAGGVLSLETRPDGGTRSRVAIPMNLGKLPI